MRKVKYYTPEVTFSYIAALMIGAANTNQASIDFFSILRAIFLSVTFLFFICYWIACEIDFKTIASAVLLLIFYIYGALQSSINSDLSYPLESLIQSYLIVIMGVFLFSVLNERSSNQSISKYYTIFAVGVTLYLVANGGLVLALPPYFNYDIKTAYGSQIYYRQGTSAFFGLAALLVVWLRSGSGSKSRSISLTFLAVIFLLLSFLGGGRGEIFTLFLFGFAYLFFKDKLGTLYLAITVTLLIAITLVSNQIFYDDFIAVKTLLSSSKVLARRMS
ncbi:hypothetical protein N9A93_02895, partial [Akkermansiaceae bacterium]|nr:hypothetical protein [Akkermansiaceae bacterium]